MKVRLAFRIIEIGKRRSLRTEMREIVILDRSIGQVQHIFPVNFAGVGTDIESDGGFYGPRGHAE